MSLPAVPDLKVEIAFDASPLDAITAKAVLTGAANSYLSTPDASALRVTGDIDIVARISLDDWTPAGDTAVVAKYAFLNAGYMMSVTPTGALGFWHTADGASAISQGSSVGPFVNGTAYWVRVTLDVNDGAGNRVYTFYWAPDSQVEPTTWTTLSTHTVAGTTSIFASTAQLEVGTWGSGAWLLDGDVYRAIVRNGIGGTVVADLDIADAFTASSTSWGSTRVSGQTWTKGSAASLTITPTWTDVSSYVRSVNGVTISRGKQTEVQTTASGSASLTLDNRTRLFDPTYAAGTYYGKLLPRKPVRIRAAWAGATYPMFVGYVEAWPQRFMFKKDASVPLSAYDALAVLAESEVRPAVVEYLDSLGGLKYFLLTADGNQWHDIQGGTPARLASGNFATSNIATLDGDGVSFDGGSTFNFVRNYGTTSGSYSFWIQTTAVGPSTTVWDNIFTSSTVGNPLTIVGIGSDGKLYYQGSDFTPGSYASANTIVKVNTGLPTHICIVHDGVTSLKIYVNGEDQTDIGAVVNASYVPDVVNIGSKGATMLTGDNFTGTIQHFAATTTVLTAAQVLNAYKIGLRDFVETTAARADRILDDVGWPGSATSLTTVPQADVAEIPSGFNVALSLLQTVADSEQGRLFVSRNGLVTLQNRYWHITNTRGSTVQMTFSDDGSDFVYSALGFDYSDREVANRITVTGSFGANATDEDTASQADYGLQAETVSTLLATQNEVVSMASGLIGRRAEPIIRTDAITVQPARQTSAWPTVLGLELGDRIVVELSPMGVSPQLTQTLLVERLDWSIAVDNWRVAITGSPVPDEAYWQLGTSVLGTSTRLAW